MKPNGIIPGITALCAILGILIGVQYNTVQSQAVSAAGTDNVRLTELSAEGTGGEGSAGKTAGQAGRTAGDL